MDLMPSRAKEKREKGKDDIFFCCKDKNESESYACDRINCSNRFHKQCLQSKFFYSKGEINRIRKENEMFICPKCTLDELVTGKTDDKKKEKTSKQKRRSQKPFN